MASKKIKNNLTKFDKGVSKIKDVTLMVNDYAYDTTETILVEAVKRGEKWQDLTAKAIDGGFKLAANQQDIVFNTLTGVKTQLQSGTEKVKTLFGRN